MQNSQSGQIPMDQVEEEQPWYLKYGVRGLGTVAGGLAMLLGALNLIFSIFSPTCIVFSIWQMLLGFVVVTIESPCCCVFVDHIQKVTTIVESKPLWMKAAIYIGAPIPAIIFCVGFYTVIGCGLILATGVVYALMALGKKASREEMVRNAQNAGFSSNNYSNTTNGLSRVSVEKKEAPPRPVAPWESNPTPNRPPQPMPTFTDLQQPPPSYYSSTVQPGWDTSYINGSTNSVNNVSANPVPNNPYNPFQ